MYIKEGTLNILEDISRLKSAEVRETLDSLFLHRTPSGCNLGIWRVACLQLWDHQTLGGQNLTKSVRLTLWPCEIIRHPRTRSRVGKSPWVFRLSLCLVDFTAMVFRHVLLAASFLARPATNLVSKFWPVPLWSLRFLASGSARPKHRGKCPGLGMCKVRTEAVHSVALWTRVTLQVWTCYIRFGHV